MKAKKIISFCSMFSLVLILSVYYVMSPISTGDQGVSNIENNEDLNVEVMDGESAYFANLFVLKESAYLDEIKELEAIVASAKASREDKIKALETKDKITKNLKNEKVLSNAIKNKGFDNAYVEYENDKINILVSKKEPSSKDAETIISTIYPLIDKSFTPIVSFKS